jgi:DNA gyrase/topoisomerase IV subunit B
MPPKKSVSSEVSLNTNDAAASNKYKALNQRNALLQRPDMVLGSIERSEHKATRLYDATLNRMVFRDVTYSAALMQVIQELFTNAGDREFKRDPIRLIEIEVPSVEDSADKPIIVRNDGDGIPILLKALDDDIGGGEKYIPEICFSVFNAGENFDDDEVRWCGGRNGIGAKACNVYSRRFTVRVKDPLRKKQYEQEYWDNMGQRSQPHIKAYANKSGMVEVSMLPDYARFGYADGKMDETVRALIVTRAYDLAACTGAHIRVKLNGVELKVRGMQQYADLMFGDDRKAAPRVYICQQVPFSYAKSTQEDSDEKAASSQKEEQQQVARLEVVIAHADADQGAHIVGFVNALPCNAGKHVQYLLERIAGDTIKYFQSKKASKTDAIDTSLAVSASSSSSSSAAVGLGGGGDFCDYSKLKPAMIRNNLSMIVKVLVDNPEFTSQSKEELGTLVSKWGFKVALPDDLPTKVQKLGVVRSAMYEAAVAEHKAIGRAMATTSTVADSAGGGRLTRRPDVAKLDDANKAGVKGEHNVLVLIEGDSAKEMTLAGISVVGKDNWGVFPLRGKMLNVARASMENIAKNVEVQNLCKVLGVKPGQPIESAKQMRYQQIFMLTDSDDDGAHIGGLIMSAIQTMWPRVVANDPSFFVRFRTPVRVARLKEPRLKEKSQQQSRGELFFLTENEYAEWLTNGTIPLCNSTEEDQEEEELHDNLSSAAERLSKYKITFLKGLGTSTNKMAMRYFRYLKRFVVEIDCSLPDERQMLQTAFGKDADDRKEFVDMYRSSSSNQTASIDYSRERALFSEFMRSELCGYWYAACRRNLPHAVDGLKPSQRKAVYHVMTSRHPCAEERISILAGKIISNMAYHHGEASMIETLVAMAQNHLGTNNINLLVPQGQFGSLILPRTVHASARYIYSYQEQIATALLPAADFPVLLRLSDDGVKVEPAFLAPIVPLLLINGAGGIGSGYSSDVPCYKPADIVQLVIETASHYVDVFLARAFAEFVAERVPSNATLEEKPFTIGARGWLSAAKQAEWVSAGTITDETGGKTGGEKSLPTPWFDLFGGTILPVDGKPGSFVVSGCFERLADGVHVRITELPVGQWKDVWKENVVARNLYDPNGGNARGNASKGGTAAVSKKRAKNADAEQEEDDDNVDEQIVDDEAAPKKKARKEKGGTKAEATGFVIDVARDDSTHAHVDLVLRCDAAQLAKLSDAELIKALRLQTLISSKQMVLWTPENKLRHYADVREIVREFVVQRHYVYELRKAYQVALLEHKYRLTRNQHRFIDAIVHGRLEVRNRTDEQIVRACEAEGLERNIGGSFAWQHPDAPLLALLEKNVDNEDDGDNDGDKTSGKDNSDGDSDVDDDDGNDDENDDSDNETVGRKKGGAKKRKDKYDGYGYLLKQNIASLSRKKMLKLAENASKIEREIDIVRGMSVQAMWRNDLEHFEREYAEFLLRKADSLQNNVEIEGIKPAAAASNAKNKKRKTVVASNASQTRKK